MRRRRTSSSRRRWRTTSRSRSAATTSASPWNSVVIAFGSTAARPGDRGAGGLLHGVLPTKRTKGTLLWMLSTKMLPPVGVLVPIYLLAATSACSTRAPGADRHHRWSTCRSWSGCCSPTSRTCPSEILEAGRMDGAKPWQEIFMCCCRCRCQGMASTGAAVAHPVLERGVLVPQPDLLKGRTTDRVHRLVLQPRRPVLGQAVGGLDPGVRADPGVRLDQPETTGARPDVRRREIGRPTMATASTAQPAQELSARSRSSRASTWTSTTASSWSSSVRRAAASPPCCG